MRAGGRDAIGQLADAGDDCAGPGRYWGAGAGGPALWPATQLASWTRDSRPSLARICDTCVLTVGTEMNKAEAIAGFDSPSATSRATSSSRVDSSKGSGAPVAVRAGRAADTVSLCAAAAI